ncbi:hypothetical protein K443DRAFT_489511 [Laccaria amethystina LaAM-08-1]|uniref:Uncharacterized protein n=1 Tax=Laccaria amethystina LaAM-08-1 TaxID=1095629 RepID=A0A0C9WMT2_9AGAR|nr:hypothetical protein K443DRAFT_489511 [Laccaria amethystina LaAM-08-1]
MAAVEYVEGFSSFRCHTHDRNQCGCQQSDFGCGRSTFRASKLYRSGYLPCACLYMYLKRRWASLAVLYNCVCISKVSLQHGY